MHNKKTDPSVTGMRREFALAALIFLFGLLSAGCGSSTAPPPEKPPAPLKETRATFLAAGDIMLSRGVARTIDAARDPLVPFSGLKELFNSTDFNFANLESPVSGNDNRVGRGLVFNARRADTEGLVKYNFKVVNLANNHAMDQGLAGLNHTQEFLTEKGIEYLGVGPNKADAWKPKYLTVKGIKIGFIGVSYASINDNGASTNDYVARIEEVDRLRASIKQAKSESDFVLVTMHAGTEYVRIPNQAQIDFARAAVDAGADIVIGAHPHWIQTFEKYKDKYIFYSLGNFIFDQMPPDRREGLALHITLLKSEGGGREKPKTRGEKIELIPVMIERMGVPRRANEAEARAIMKKFGATEAILKGS
jgi:poly-gamma-glutamate synthesis protein (capsule biosynthesis protein)